MSWIKYLKNLHTSGFKNQPVRQRVGTADSYKGSTRWEGTAERQQCRRLSELGNEISHCVSAAGDNAALKSCQFTCFVVLCPLRRQHSVRSARVCALRVIRLIVHFTTSTPLRLIGCARVVVPFPRNPQRDLHSGPRITPALTIPRTNNEPGNSF